MNFGKRRRLSPRVNIVPMIDVVLQLLLFFVLTTTFGTGAEGMKVDLPKTTARGDAVGEIVIVVDREGGLLYHDQAVSILELGRLLREEPPGSPENVAVIKADRDARHGRVVEVMDVIRGAGIRRMAIGTEPAGGPPGQDQSALSPP